MGLIIKNKSRGRKIINHHIVEGTRESHPRVHDLQHPRLGKPRRGLQIMDTRMGSPCPFHSVVIYSIIPGLISNTPLFFYFKFKVFRSCLTIHQALLQYRFKISRICEK